jgi:hypothetical protein
LVDSGELSFEVDDGNDDYDDNDEDYEEWNCSFTLRLFYTRRNLLLYPFDNRLIGFQTEC